MRYKSCSESQRCAVTNGCAEVVSRACKVVGARSSDPEKVRQSKPAVAARGETPCVVVESSNLKGLLKYISWRVLCALDGPSWPPSYNFCLLEPLYRCTSPSLDTPLLTSVGPSGACNAYPINILFFLEKWFARATNSRTTFYPSTFYPRSRK